jgi:hypothetical protein
MYVLSSATGYLRVGGLIKQRRNPLLTQITNVYIHIYLCIYVSLYCCAYIDPPNLERLTYIHNHNRRVCVGGEDAADATHDQDTKPRRRGSSRVVQGLTAVWAGKEGEYEGGGSTAQQQEAACKYIPMWPCGDLSDCTQRPEAKRAEGGSCASSSLVAKITLPHYYSYRFKSRLLGAALYLPKGCFDSARDVPGMLRRKV